MKSLKELAEERAALAKQNQELLDKADADGRTLTAEDEQEWDNRDKEIDRLGDEIGKRTAHETRKQRQQSLAGELERPLPRQIAALAPGATANGDGASLTLDFGRAGKISLAELAAAHPERGKVIQARASDSYRLAFNAFLRGEGTAEQLGLVVGSDPHGGYLAPMSFISTLIKFLDDDVTLRRLGTVLPPTSAKSVGLLSYDTDPGDADWTAEVPASDISEDTAMRFGNREMAPHQLTKLLKASQKLIRASILPIDTFIAQRLAYKFGITENKAFLTGSGSQRPLGVFTASNDGIATSRDVTASATTSFNADDLINTQESLKDAYQQKATWLMHRDARKMARKLKDGNGQYIWQPGLSGGAPDTILNRPLVTDENAPNTFTTGQYVAMFADFSFYWIQDDIGLEIQRLGELFALRNQVGWLGRKFTDAMPVLGEAFARLKLA